MPMRLLAFQSPGRQLRRARAATLFGAAVASIIAIAASPARAVERLPLAGEWQFAMGSPAPVFPQGARPAVEFRETILLPGTTETRGKGPVNPAAETTTLTRIRKFDGPAWYQRGVEIPANWHHRRVLLELERTKYTQVWWDDEPVGEQGLYTATQRYDLSRWAKPGPHRLTVMVDNRPERRPVQGDAHQFSDNTQTNWNGLLGRLELVSQPAWSIDEVQVYPDLAGRRFRVHVATSRMAASSEPAEVLVRTESFNHAGAPHRPAAARTSLPAGEGAAAADLWIALGDDARAWDEFSPALYRMVVTLESPSGRDERTVECGWREFKTRGGQFAINGRTTFLRGKHDGCVFPLTGHPPMEVEGWLAYLRICQSYGINHIRCHTWVPPEAAFAAADRLGVYLQPELPFWGTFDAKVRDFLWPEAEATLKAYGNHPSFVMMTLGNELGGDRPMMNAMVSRLKAADPRHLYADGSNNVLWDPRLQPTNDFWPTAKTKTPASGDRALPVRGSYYFGDGYDGVVQWGPAQTRQDLRAGIAGLGVPVVGHEIAQYTSYPDFHELAAFTGVTRPRNLDRFRSLLEQTGRLGQAQEFARASGHLVASLYREDIELALRTPGFGGFQLLDLQDFPGQGTALVGVLDVFMQSKGFITPEQWRRFCGPIVPLARFDRYTWTNRDRFEADLEVAHFGSSDLVDAITAWRLRADDGSVIAEGEFDPTTVKQGGLRTLGRVEVPLGKVAAPSRCEFEVSVRANGARHENSWPLWVYSATVESAPAANVTLVHAFDAETRRLLAQGRRVVLIPEVKNWAYTVSGAYATDFWCWPMFHSSPGTMGLWCDAQHPALARFPTRGYSERQWSAIAHAATPVILTGAPQGFRPIVQVIDNLERNDLLALAFEARVGPGSLLVIACDLASLSGAPEAQQLLASVLAYAQSERFAPQTSLEPTFLDQVLRPSLAREATVTASSSLKPSWGFVPLPSAATDGDINTWWQAAEDDRSPWLQLDLGRQCDVDTIELLWESAASAYRYRVEGSADGTAWTLLAEQPGAGPAVRDRRAVLASGIRHVRVTLSRWPAGHPPLLRDVRVLGAPASNAVL